MSIIVSAMLNIINVKYVKVNIRSMLISPSFEVAFRIAHVFGKPLEEVFHWTE